MTLESPVEQEKYIYKELSIARVKVTNSVLIFCKYLFDNALNHGRYYYPSLNSFKYDEQLCLSSRSIDRLVLSLVENSILIKFPRTKVQSYQINLNNTLFRFILAIYHSTLSISLDRKLETTPIKRIKELQNSKEHLKYILNRLKSEDDYKLAFCSNILRNISESVNVSNTSKDDLKESLRSIIIEYSKNTEISNFSILNDFLQEDKGE